MSLPQTYGLSSVVFGNPATITGYVVQSFDASNKCGVVAEIFNETGQRVASRYDDLTTEITFEAIINGATLPTPGAEFTYNAIKYETLTVDQKWTNKSFTSATIKGKVSANLSLP
jgi:hypothetical protein